jgi:hypothetical protein
MVLCNGLEEEAGAVCTSKATASHGTATSGSGKAFEQAEAVRERPVALFLIEGNDPDATGCDPVPGTSNHNPSNP